MIFLFPKKKIVLDCFTSDPEVFQFVPIVESAKCFPNWWKELPKSKVCFKNIDASNVSNMRNCTGLVDLYKNSFSIRMWSDLLLQIGKAGTTEYRWQYADNKSTLSIHSAEQRGTYLNKEEYQHFKLNTPWVLKTNRHVNFFWSGATWNTNQPEKIILLPAILNYYYQASASINFMCKRASEVEEILIPFNQPLVHITPLTEHKVILKNHLVSNEELNTIKKRTTFISSFINSYGKLKKLKKEKNDTEL
jgi:hypothetical protein